MRPLTKIPGSAPGCWAGRRFSNVLWNLAKCSTNQKFQMKWHISYIVPLFIHLGWPTVVVHWKLHRSAFIGIWATPDKVDCWHRSEILSVCIGHYCDEINLRSTTEGEWELPFRNNHFRPRAKKLSYFDNLACNTLWNFKGLFENFEDVCTLVLSVHVCWKLKSRTGFPI